MKKHGRVIKKRIKKSFWKKDKHFLTVKFDTSYNRNGDTMHDYLVGKDIYYTLIIGANISSNFDQIPNGTKPTYLY